MPVNETADKFLAFRLLRGSRVRLEDVWDTRSNGGAEPGMEAGQISEDGASFPTQARIGAGGLAVRDRQTHVSEARDAHLAWQSSNFATV